MKVLQTLAEEFELYGLRGKLLEVDSLSLEVASSDFYVRRSLDRAHVERLKSSLSEGEELPPVVVGFVNELGGYRIIEGNHSTKAYQELKKPVRVLYVGELSLEEADRLQIKLNPAEKLFLKEEDLKHLVIKRYRGRDRNTDVSELIRKLSLIVGRQERTIYRWLAPAIKEEEKEQKNRVYELIDQGHTLDEISQMTGFPKSTIARWKTERFRGKEVRVERPDFPGREFLALLEEYFAERNDSQRGFAGLESFCKQRDLKITGAWDELKRRLSGLMVEEWVKNIKGTREDRKRALAQALSQIFPKGIAEKLSVDAEVLWADKLEKEKEDFLEILKDTCQKKPVDIREQVARRMRAIGGSFYRQKEQLFLAIFEEEFRQCEEKHPLLKVEDLSANIKESLLSLEDRQTMRKELEKAYPEHRIPEQVVETLFQEKKNRVAQELEKKVLDLSFDLTGLTPLEREVLEGRQWLLKKRQEMQEEETYGRLLEKLRENRWETLEDFISELAGLEQEVAIKRKADLWKVFSSLPAADDEFIKNLAIRWMEESLSDVQIRQAFLEAGYRPEVRRVLEVKKLLLEEARKKLRQEKEESVPQEESPSQEQSKRTIGFKGLEKKIEAILEKMEEHGELLEEYIKPLEALLAFEENAKKVEDDSFRNALMVAMKSIRQMWRLKEGNRRIKENMQDLIDAVREKKKKEEEKKLDHHKLALKSIYVINEIYKHFYGGNYIHAKDYAKFLRLIDQAISKFKQRAEEKNVENWESKFLEGLVVIMVVGIHDGQSPEGLLMKFMHNYDKTKILLKSGGSITSKMQRKTLSGEELSREIKMLTGRVAHVRP